MNGTTTSKVPIAHWREMLKMHSLYFLGALAFVPEVLEYMVAAGYISPADSGMIFKVCVFITAMARIYQRKHAAQADGL